MAKKPRSQWSAAYRRRVERAERAGKSRQQARGHRPREHITRAQNKARKVKRQVQRKLTKQQLRTIHNFARSQSKRIGITTRELEGNLKDFVREAGFDRLKVIIKKQKQLREQYRSEVKRKRYATRGEDFLEDIGEDLGFPEIDYADVGWLYYH